MLEMSQKSPTLSTTTVALRTVWQVFCLLLEGVRRPHDGCTSLRTVQRTVEMPQVQFLDPAVDVPVLLQRQVLVIRNVRKTVEVPQVQYVDEIVEVPVAAQSWSKFWRSIVEETDVLVPRVKEEIIEVAKHGSLEHVQNCT